MNFNFKKIASAASSALMIGSTVALAAAANYPAPFVSGSSADVAIIVGDSATADLAPAASLSADLSTRFVAGGGRTTTTTTTIDGENFPLFTGSSQLYLNSTVNSVRSTLTDAELPTILADSEISGNADAEITHTIALGSNSRLTFAKQPDSGEDDPIVGIALGTSSTNYIYNMTATFDNAIAFNDTETEGESFMLFGQKFTVGGDSDGNEIVLLKSTNSFTLRTQTNPTTSVTIGGEEYTVELLSAEDTQATIKVTDSAGNSDEEEINEDDSKKLLDVEVSVENSNEPDNSESYATISVGSSNDRLVLQDGAEVEVGSNGDTIEDTLVDISTNTGSVTSITIQVWADNDFDAITPGTPWVDPVFGSFKIDFTGLNIPSDFDGDDRESIVVQNSGDDLMTVNFEPDYSTDSKTIEWYNNESSPGTPKLADSDRDFIQVREYAVLNDSTYAVVGNEEDGRFIQLTKFTNSSSGYDNDDIEFTDVFSGDKYGTTITAEGTGTVSIGGNTFDVKYVDSTTDGAEFVTLGYPDSSGNGVVVFPTIQTSKGALLSFTEPTTINLTDIDMFGTNAASLYFPDGDGYTSYTVTLNEVGNFTIDTTVLGNGTATMSKNVGSITYNFTQTAAHTVRINLMDGASAITRPALLLFEEQEDDGDAYNEVVVQVAGEGTSASELEVGTITVGQSLGSALTLESNDDLQEQMSKWGTIVQTDDADASGTDQKKATISYPDDQVEAMVYVAEADASAVGGSSGALGDIVYDASEVSSVSNKNLIVLGGSCINTVAASLLGSSTPLCGADFTAETQVGSGSFLISSYASPYNSDKIALLVAGYDAADTMNAANALKSQTVDTTVNKKYTGTTATSLTPVL